MLHTAAAVLVQEAASAVLALQPKDRDAYVQIIEEVANRHGGGFSRSDYVEAAIAFEELGVERAVALARSIYVEPRKEVLFREYTNAVFRGEDPDLATTIARAEEELEGEDLAYWKGMMDCFIAFGPRPEPTPEQRAESERRVRGILDTIRAEEAERKGLGLDDDDVAAS